MPRKHYIAPETVDLDEARAILETAARRCSTPDDDLFDEAFDARMAKVLSTLARVMGPWMSVQETGAPMIAAAAAALHMAETGDLDRVQP